MCVCEYEYEFASSVGKGIESSPKIFVKYSADHREVIGHSSCLLKLIYVCNMSGVEGSYSFAIKFFFYELFEHNSIEKVL